MHLYQSFTELEQSLRPAGSVCTVGTFDGVHLGHQVLLRALVDDAHSHDLPAALVTFFPHPRVVLGRSPTTYLTLPEEKAHQMGSLGVDILVVITFTRETIQVSADEFVKLMITHLCMSSLWIGPDFALGNKRQGDAGFLRNKGVEYGFTVHEVAPVNAGLESVSSTRIRVALARGDFREVNLCLGRRFNVMGMLDDPLTIRVPIAHALPAPGHYPVLVCGEPYTVSITAPALAENRIGNIVQLDHPAHCDPSARNNCVIEFLDS